MLQEKYLGNLTLNMQTKVAELMSAAEESKAPVESAESVEPTRAETAPEVDECQRHVEDGGWWESLAFGGCFERGNSRGTMKI